jgi:GGDEF domain-containing protein
LRRAVTDAVLSSVRDSDVLARVEDDEYYLLLPETAMLGASAARRRIERKFAASEELARLGLGEVDPIVGIAVYPGDGADLGRLLRVSRRRSERSRNGPYRQMRLARRSFWDSVDLLLDADEGEAARDEISLGAHVTMTRALVSRVASQVAMDAIRSKAPGTLYVAGDEDAAAAVASALAVGGDGQLRAWILGGESGRGDPIRLQVHDARLSRQILLLSVTELGGYFLVARPSAGGSFRAYHSADPDLVGGLVAALQATYHLQPEAAR